MFAKRLELIKGRKKLDTAPHLKFDKFHHNKRLAIKLQRCILGSLVQVCLPQTVVDFWALSSLPSVLI